MTPEQQAQLRAPFDPKLIGKKPKGGVMLDFVGHGAVRDRFLQVDPGWTWEPLAVDAAGFPALDVEGNLWIELTIGDVSRIGVGDGPNMKERIGDALRNAGMSFGVALDLWIKGDPALHENPVPPVAPTLRKPPTTQAEVSAANYEADIRGQIGTLNDDQKNALKIWMTAESLKVVGITVDQGDAVVAKIKEIKARESTSPSHGSEGVEGVSDSPADAPAPSPGSPRAQQLEDQAVEGILDGFPGANVIKGPADVRAALEASKKPAPRKKA